MQTEITLEVVCEGNYFKGKKDFFSDGQWFPGDPPMVFDFKVFLLGGQNENTEITHYLTDQQIINLQTEFIEEQEEA